MFMLWNVVLGLSVLGAGVLVFLGLRLRARRRARTEMLKEAFGAEYDRVVDDEGRRKGERILEDRRTRILASDVSPIRPAARQSYTERWRNLQHWFIDHPRESVRTADVLLVEVMNERGLPTIDFSDRAAAVALERPNRVEAYRQAHRLFVDIEREADADRPLEDYRDALLTYRGLFEAFLNRPKYEARRRVDIAG